ncbi:hypothetical protein MMC25_004394 [Agyrium rufum]|nr:hypothetical protein [Agyrium rufum]
MASLPNGVVAAQLETISVSSLRSTDVPVAHAENDKLFAACRETGCFYLDFRESDGNLTGSLADMYQLLEDLHSLPTKEKLRFDVDKLQQSRMKLNGYDVSHRASYENTELMLSRYKPLGRNFAGLKANKDGFATYTIPKDGVLGLIDDEDFVRPEAMDKHMDPLKTFTRTMNDATHSILSSLSASLGLPEDKTLQDYHRLNVSSPDIIRLLKYDSQPASERGDTHTAHTDIGTLTFLFTRQPGLQMFSSASQTWTWILPHYDLCPIVNLGDSMAMLTNKFFPSCLHKVGPPPNGGVIGKRSIAYLVRPEIGRPLVGTQTKWIPAISDRQEVYSAKRLLEEKFKALRGDTKHSILVGQMETDGQDRRALTV